MIVVASYLSNSGLSQAYAQQALGTSLAPKPDLHEGCCSKVMSLTKFEI